MYSYLLHHSDPNGTTAGRRRTAPISIDCLCSIMSAIRGILERSHLCWATHCVTRRFPQTLRRQHHGRHHRTSGLFILIISPRRPLPPLISFPRTAYVASPPLKASLPLLPCPFCFEDSGARSESLGYFTQSLTKRMQLGGPNPP